MKDNRPSGGPRVAVAGSLEAASWAAGELGSGSGSVADGDVCVDLP